LIPKVFKIYVLSQIAVTVVFIFRNKVILRAHGRGKGQQSVTLKSDFFKCLDNKNTCLRVGVYN